MQWVCRLPLAPVLQAAAVFGHHERNAVSSDAIVNQPANPFFVPEALHDADLPEGCCLQSTRSVCELICHGKQHNRYEVRAEMNDALVSYLLANEVYLLVQCPSSSFKRV